MSKAARKDLKKIRGVIAENILELVPSNTEMMAQYFGISINTLKSYREGKTKPSPKTIKSLLSRVKIVYKENYYIEDKNYVEKLSNWLVHFNQALLKAGVICNSKKIIYIEDDENILEKIIPFCEELVTSNQKVVPYLFYYRPKNKKKLEFPAHLSPKFMEKRITIGRKKECSEIDQLLENSNHPVFLYSFAGLGKTSIANKYSCEVSRREPLFISIPTNSDDVIYDFLAEVDSDQLEELSSDEKSKKYLTTAFYNYVEKMKGHDDQVLLIVDNVSTIKQLYSVEKFRPLINIGWQVLVTTRVMDNALKNRNVYSIGSLSLEDCLKLFEYYYFDGDTASKLTQQEKVQLKRLFEDLDSHTFLIKLLAKVGHNSGTKISNLIDIIKQKKTDPLWSPTIWESYVHDDENHENREISSIILALFDLSNLKESEIQVLSYFSLLPDVPISQEYLIAWLSDNKHLDTLPLKTILYKLHQEGWLILENDRSYKCHCLIQSAIHLSPKIRKYVDFRPFIQNITNYLDFPQDGVERTDVFKNIRILSPVVARYTEQTLERYHLIKQYLSCCAQFNNFPEEFDIYHNYSQEMLFLKNLFFPETSPEYQIENVTCQDIYNDVFLVTSEEKGKMITVLEKRKQNAATIESIYDEKPLLCIRVKQKYASSLHRDGCFEDALNLLGNIEKQIKSKLNQENIENKKEWQYALFTNYEQQGIINNGRYRHSKNGNYIYKALAIRTKYLALGEEFLTEDSYKLRSCHNDLGMTYLYLFDELKKDTNQNNEAQKKALLKKAKEHMKYSYRTAIERYGKKSARCILPIKNFSSYFIRKQNFSAAKFYATYAYKQMKLRPGSSKERRLMIAARLLGIIYLEEYLYETIKHKSHLDKSLHFLNESLEISNFLYGIEKNIDSDRNLEFITQVNEELAKLDN